MRIGTTIPREQLIRWSATTAVAIGVIFLSVALAGDLMKVANTPAQMMAFRQTALQETHTGYQMSGVPLVAHGNLTSSYTSDILDHAKTGGPGWGPAGWTDDIGIYYAIPMIASGMEVTTNTAAQWFYVGSVAAGYMFGVAGLCLLLRSPIAKAFGALAVYVLTTVVLRTERLTPVSGYLRYGGGLDVYVLPLVAVLSLVPILLFALRRWDSGDSRDTRRLAMTIGAVTFLAVVANVFRIHSGTPIIILSGILVVFNRKFPLYSRFGLVCAMAGAVLAASAVTAYVVHDRDAFLEEQIPGYLPVRTEHPKWHSAYISFGFLQNPYGIEYKDEVAVRLVRAIDPNATYLSPEYETILREEIVLLAERDPGFFYQTLSAKGGVMLFYLVFFANFGLIGTYLYQREWSYNAAFAAALAMAALPGLAGIPMGAYIIGFCGLATIYGLVGIDEALTRGVVKDLVRLGGRIWSTTLATVRDAWPRG